MTSSHAHSRLLIRREQAEQSLGALEVGQTLEIADGERGIYAELDKHFQAQGRRFRWERVNHGMWVSWVGTREC